MKRTDAEILSAAVKGFLGDYLPHQRACSPHTILSYRDSLKLLLQFAAGTKRQLTGLAVEHLSPPLVAAFLDHLESKRGNQAATRNVRLTAIHSFFEYLGREHPEHLWQAQRVLSVPFKRTTQRTVDYLDADELRRVLEAVDRSTLLGRRDYSAVDRPVQHGCPRAGDCFIKHNRSAVDPTPVHQGPRQRKKRAHLSPVAGNGKTDPAVLSRNRVGAG